MGSKSSQFSRHQDTANALFTADIKPELSPSLQGYYQATDRYDVKPVFGDSMRSSGQAIFHTEIGMHGPPPLHSDPHMSVAYSPENREHELSTF